MVSTSYIIVRHIR